MAQFLENFAPRGDYAGFDLPINGRKVVALGECEGVSPPLGDVPLQLLLCNDVLLVTATGKDDKHVLVRPPFPRAQLSILELDDYWEDDIMALADSSAPGTINYTTPLHIRFASHQEKNTWSDLLHDMTGVTATSSLMGPRFLTTQKRSAHELAVLLGIADPNAKYGAAELAEEFNKVPLVCLLAGQREKEHRQPSL